nr:hypothetical protein MarFTME_261 [Marseillevirus futianmevirus]
MSLDQNESHLQTVFDRRREEVRHMFLPYEPIVFDFPRQENFFSKPSWNKFRELWKDETEEEEALKVPDWADDRVSSDEEMEQELPHLSKEEPETEPPELLEWEKDFGENVDKEFWGKVSKLWVETTID